MNIVVMDTVSNGSKIITKVVTNYQMLMLIDSSSWRCTAQYQFYNNAATTYIAFNDGGVANNDDTRTKIAIEDLFKLKFKTKSNIIVNRNK